MAEAAANPGVDASEGAPMTVDPEVIPRSISTGVRSTPRALADVAWSGTAARRDTNRATA